MLAKVSVDTTPSMVFAGSARGGIIDNMSIFELWAAADLATGDCSGESLRVDHREQDVCRSIKW